MQGNSSTLLAQSISKFGIAVKAKLTSFAAKGAPEDQLRSPFEILVKDIAEVCGLNGQQLVLIGENTIKELAARPDYAVTYRDELIGHIELKAPGKGADPRKYATPHDKEQGKKLRSLPNVIFTDGESFSLWQEGKIVGRVESLEGELSSAGADLRPSNGLLALFESFLKWQPIAPTSPKQLAEISARLCRLLRDEVAEQLEREAPALVSIAEDWRHLLFPQATNDEFADGYAQAVTFGLLLARAKSISFDHGIAMVAHQLGNANSLIGRALSILTDQAVSEGTLATSVRTLMRVLSVVDWPTLSKGDPEVWLYFYEDFLAVYDNALRRKTGSYYTPPEIVRAMTAWTDEALVHYLGRPSGLADGSVVLVDPAMGTGAYLLEALRKIASRVAEDQGVGAVGPFLESALKRLIGFEIQLGPYAVSQLRILAELAELGSTAKSSDLRTYVTDTLGNPYVEDDLLAATWYAPIAESRRQANKVKREEPVLVVIGNPPYKEKAKGRGGWIESGSPDTGAAKFQAFIPPAEWGISAHTKHLYNLYVFFWRWATWKVFEQHPDSGQGIISFITVAGFLDGEGFEKMRATLRSQADHIWVIDCSPEGHQPIVNTRVFQAVQHPVCIVLAVKDGTTDSQTPATVRWRSLPVGHRDTKFESLPGISLGDAEWEPVSSDWRAPFTPIADDTWAEYPALADLFDYSGSGMMPGRTWVYAPDSETLERRWEALVSTADVDRKRALFSEHKQDRTLEKVLKEGLPGFPAPKSTIGAEKGKVVPPVRIAYRTLDRQWIIPDKRLINRPNPTLWASRSDRQIFMTVLTATSPSSGPAVTFSALVPDIDHYKGHAGGRVYPLWRDAGANNANVPSGLLALLSAKYETSVSAEDVYAYIAAIAAHPGYVTRFAEFLSEPGLRIPMTADPDIFREAVHLGERVIWLHSFGERFSNPGAGRPKGAPRVGNGNGPLVSSSHPIPSSPEEMPDRLDYDEEGQELVVGSGRISNVTRRMRNYEVSGVKIVDKWFSYRRKSRERPVIGDRRVSELQSIQPEHWLPEYTSDLIDLLNAIALLIEAEGEQEQILTRVIDGSLVGAQEIIQVRDPASPRAGSAKSSATHDDIPLF